MTETIILALQHYPILLWMLLAMATVGAITILVLVIALILLVQDIRREENEEDGGMDESTHRIGSGYADELPTTTSLKHRQTHRHGHPPVRARA